MFIPTDIFTRVQEFTGSHYEANQPYVLGRPAVTAHTFAAAAHAAVGQFRKYTGDPYIVHPIEVANLVGCAEKASDSMIQAALLHDVVEDTQIEFSTIREYFGEAVYHHLFYLTDRSVQLDLKEAKVSRKIRKLVDVEHLSRATDATKTIKVADLISNSADIVVNDANFARVYLKEKEVALKALKGADEGLLEFAHILLGEGKEKLGIS